MSRSIAWQKHFLTFIALVASVLFLPSTMILLAGMMPTIAANVVDKTRQKSRTISVGMMNLAGCMPFLLELWMSSSPNSIDAAMNIIMQPKSIIIMYVLAASGYAIEAAITGMVATVMQQRAQARLKDIDRELKELVNRWEDFVDGTRPLDDYGFPIDRE